ncbi:MAG: hypothetical protein HRT69_02340 [Flavobacteriaceae bacterium]|nr:hypothetical protein [Flavobacteriaceae bacterium]
MSSIKKRILLVFLIPLFSIASINDSESCFIKSNSSGTSYCDGWNAGYKAGYCYQRIGCITPYVPVCPVQRTGESSYNDGYNRGFLKGKTNNTTTSSGDANSQLKPLQNNDYGDVMLNHVRRNRQLANERRSQTEYSFNKANRDGVSAFNSGNYEACIYYYENSKNMGWYNADFEYATGLSYYALWEKSKKEKFKSKVKKLLKLSKKHGDIRAKKALKKLKELSK